MRAVDGVCVHKHPRDHIHSANTVYSFFSMLCCQSFTFETSQKAAEQVVDTALEIAAKKKRKDKKRKKKSRSHRKDGDGSC